MIPLFPDDKQVLEGEEVVFRVKVTGVPVPELTWYHNGEEVVADYTPRIWQMMVLSQCPLLRSSTVESIS